MPGRPAMSERSPGTLIGFAGYCQAPLPIAAASGTLALAPGVLYTFMAESVASMAPLSGTDTQRRNEMTLCPVALAVGCKKCPAFGFCFLKGVIGDYKPEETKPKAQAGQGKPGAKKAK
jgi:hypothetical protein